LSVADLRSRADQLARVFTDRGVTFAYAGEERPFPLGLIPRIIDAAEWDLVTAMLAGLAESTMSRDDGWRFLVLGRNLERVDMTARLLSIQSATGDTGGSDQWRTVLRACGADESFLRTHGGHVVAQKVAEFLLLDRLFPRSALHALTEAQECLQAAWAHEEV
jgi:uncharacterized alpha-E superfamily protein